MSAQIVVFGNLGKDPESRTVGADKVVKFSVAVNHKRKDQESTSWFNVDVWGKQGDACAEYLHKGSKVMVAGSLEIRTYEKDGEKRTSADIRATQVDFADSKPKADESNPDPFA